MLMDILMESLMSMDEDTLDYVLESCSDEEIGILMEVVGEFKTVDDNADIDQLRSGYALDNRNGIKGFIKSFRDSGADKWKYLKHDMKTEAARIKHNLRGAGNDVGVQLAQHDLAGLHKKINDYAKTHTDPKDFDNKSNAKIREFDNELNDAMKNNANVTRNEKSLSYKIGNILHPVK